MTVKQRPKHATPLMRAIRETRHVYRMSQRKFAEMIGVPRSRIAGAETGWFTPTDVFLLPIARAAGVSVDDFREGKVAINRCGCCDGAGILVGKKWTRSKMRAASHPGTPHFPTDPSGG